VIFSFKRDILNIYQNICLASSIALEEDFDQIITGNTPQLFIMPLPSKHEFANEIIIGFIKLHTSFSNYTLIQYNEEIIYKLVWYILLIPNGLQFRCVRIKPKGH